MIKNKAKFFLVISILTVLLIYLTGNALAATKGPHDIYSNESAVCNNCHTIFSNSKAGLYDRRYGSQNDYYNLCVYCHNSAGQSRYDAINGTIFDPSGNGGVGAYFRMPGGGFSKYLVTKGVSTLTGNLIDVTSTHDVKGLGTNYSPGGNTALAGAFVDFSCQNCHNPHGTTNSRALVDTINGKINLAPNLIVNNELKDETITYVSGLSDFCGACHEDFNVKSAGTGDTDSGIYSRFKRHRVDVNPTYYKGYNPNHGLPLESGKMTCMTCHFAHGTAVVNGVTFDRAGSYNGTNKSNSSTLLRKNNRGVCQSCHGN